MMLRVCPESCALLLPRRTTLRDSGVTEEEDEEDRMARLRIRIELSRGGLGVRLHKVASVIAKSQKFLDLLGEDVHIDKGKGEWLGFDFDRESLNFTAEYIGAVTANQVAAFNAAFDGTTSLRRDSIVQFASITDAIGE